MCLTLRVRARLLSLNRLGAIPLKFSCVTFFQPISTIFDFFFKDLKYILKIFVLILTRYLFLAFHDLFLFSSLFILFNGFHVNSKLCFIIIKHLTSMVCFKNYCNRVNKRILKIRVTRTLPLFYQEMYSITYRMFISIEHHHLSLYFQ